MTYRPCELLIDLPQIRQNVSLLRGFLPPAVQLMAVIKADAYGHGAFPTARAALAGGADSLAVALPEEGLLLREAGIEAPILVLGAPVEAAVQACAEADLAVTVFDGEALQSLHHAGEAAGKPVAVHLKLDTGMARLGLRDAQSLTSLISLAQSLSGVRLAGLYTHLACADEPEDDYTPLQQARLDALLDVARGLNLPVHAANSAATLRYPALLHQSVRAGIAIYGCPGVDTPLPLRPAQRWICLAVQARILPAGECVGYGATFRTERETRMLVLPVGYADGYRRSLAGKAQVLVRGRRAPVIGRICMDLCMVDVTDIPGATAGDEVVLLGAQGEHRITPEEMAGWMDTIPYEVMLAPSARVPRRYLPL